jgi:hypothetical protein
MKRIKRLLSAHHARFTTPNQINLNVKKKNVKDVKLNAPIAPFGPAQSATWKKIKSEI